MATDNDRISYVSDHEQNDTSCSANVSLSDMEREKLNQRKSMLEQELNSLSAILTKSRVSKSVPNQSIDHRANSITQEPSFHGFSTCTTPYFRRDAGVGIGIGTDFIPTSTHEHECQRGNRVTQTERISNVDITQPQQTQHFYVNAINANNPSLNSSYFSSRLMGLESIDKWVEDVCEFNDRQSILSESTKRELPSPHQNRDNVRRSTHVELLNSSSIASRYGEQGTRHLDQYGLEQRNPSTETQFFDTRSYVSQHPSQWGSTKVELLNASRLSGERQQVQNHRMEQQHQRTAGQSYHLQQTSEFNHGLNARFGRNYAEVSYRQPQIHYGRGSTNVELLNTSPYYERCDDRYGHTINDVNPRQALHELPRQGERKSLTAGNFRQQFPSMGVPINENIGQNYDQRDNVKSNCPSTDQQKNSSNINRTPTRENRESQDRMNQHSAVVNNQQKDFAQSPLQMPNQSTQEQVNTDNDVMKKLVSRQILGKDLPEFRGEISKWLSFIDHYNDTTESCKFTDRENIMRLRKSLKDKALSCVESLLVSSTNPKTIIDILARRFGRPEDIVKAEIQKVKTIPSPKENDPQSIIEYATAVQNLVVTLETLNKSDHLRNPVLLDELQDKLPPTLSLLWSEYIIDRSANLNLRVLADWLDRRAEAASRRTTMKVYEVEPSQKPKFKARVNTVNASSDTPITLVTNSCYCCYGTCKSLEDCVAFAKLDVHERWEIAKKNKLCFFCLSTSHEFKDCTKKAECKIKGCKRFHHKLLHTQPKKVGIIKANVNSHITKLRIVPVILYGSSTEIRTFALLDPGSTSTLMSQNLSDLLKLDGPNSPLLLEWMNGDIAVENDSKIVNTRIQGTQDGAKIYDLFNVRTVKNLPLHKQTIDKSALIKQWPYLRTIDFEGYEDAQPQLLIGENNGLLTATRQLVHDTWNTPIASKTWLGWVISGNEGKLSDTSTVKIFTAHEIETDSRHELVKSSLNLEEASVSTQKLSRSKEDERALQLLEKYSTINDNRWETGLLWRDKQVILPESRKNALVRLTILEKKLDKNRQSYNEIIVLCPLKPGTVRIVFDAAAKSIGFSLNDYLMPGPDLLKSLISTLFKFRHEKIGFLGDIKDWFHRIKMRPADASCQKILWRGDSRSSEPEEYELDVMSFGANCSPCSATYIKDKNALRFQDKFPQAVDAILNKHYMDDYLDSSNDENDAIKLIKDVIHVHQQGSFEIRNWISSSQVVMQSIPEQLRRNHNSKVSLDHENLQDRVLGILWDTIEDVFTFNVHFAKIDSELLTGEKKPTKRKILSIINFVFDPLGFVAHLMNFEKSFLNNMQRITEVKIDRCYTDSCIRFTEKHICPTEMYSDNGTNLRGCDNELQANLQELNQDKIRSWMTTHRIKWFFNPPTAANMGGSWEQLVRSIKTALYATHDTIHPSDDVLATLLAEAQHVTNSRHLLEIFNHQDEKRENWPRGIITAVFPGIDDEIRVIDVTTRTGTYRRPMNKICLLESTITSAGVSGGECLKF